MDDLLDGYNQEQLQQALDSMTPAEASELCSLIEAERQHECRWLRLYVSRWLDYGTQPASDAVPFNSLFVGPGERPRTPQVAGDSQWWQGYPDALSGAQRKFWWLFGRAPEEGDVLKFEHLQAESRLDLTEVEHFRGLWSKYVSGAEFPLKVEDDRIYVRHNQALGWPEWQLDSVHDAREQWTEIERRALGFGYGKHKPEVVPSIAAVVFEGDGIRAADKGEEVREMIEAGGLLGMLCSKNQSESEAAS